MACAIPYAGRIFKRMAGGDKMRENFMWRLLVWVVVFYTVNFTGAIAGPNEAGQGLERFVFGFIY